MAGVEEETVVVFLGSLGLFQKLNESKSYSGNQERRVESKKPLSELQFHLKTEEDRMKQVLDDDLQIPVCFIVSLAAE